MSKLSQAAWPDPEVDEDPHEKLRRPLWTFEAIRGLEAAYEEKSQIAWALKAVHRPFWKAHLVTVLTDFTCRVEMVCNAI